MEMDTIAAISTAIGEGGIAIIRVSGNNAIDIVDSLFKGKKKLSTVDSHTINYGYLIDINGEIIDEVLVSVMRAPKTFTREDVVEVNCHGGIIAAKRVLDTILENGARLAEPGEFTKRAFLNGRIDLSQAEAIMDLIRSKTERAMKLAMRQVEGKLSDKIKEIRKELLEILAHIEVNIDYPEHDIESITHEFLLQKTTKVKDDINFLLSHSNQGKILRDGISTVIVGRPNVGKSSLLNTLLRENKAIVTEIPGTTRDVIEEYISINGVPLKLVDTAGIRETEDLVEKIGVERSRKALSDADLILLVFNNNEELTSEDIKLIDLVKGLRVIVVINKTDLPKELNIDRIKEKLNDVPVIYTSAKEKKGIEELEEVISKLFFEGQIQTDDLTYISNSRHIALLKNALRSVDEAIQSIEEWLPIDMIAIDIKNTMDFLGEIIGEAISDDLSDQIFSQFCVGK
ncbi:tRNA uridine-5-carboxymethylaminomethyl(34) synthesis GTPase MnmE [Vulcanibacillus modesticaldus]|uniref:tRNA modification GTPase MnmE n=1 Tax=Vulcanibacillus modesticaldus TaxID=337097 RepID=A0A1D2YVP1_9BACI|nr:tRNA uridine-5-carboxymethylaminomethyl(34) synthesis GTPase MnmE [Vulcanibacillus modesticaldus]OEF99685.1 tRNA uridine-5-carboxymethylaminomethyl(34) synthesis GTPase MnmE [Vulcanibacillus modesticaldus]